MKKCTILFSALFVLFNLISCNKSLDCPDDCPLLYDEVGDHGLNILYGAEELVLTEVGGYSFRAYKPFGKSLKIKLELIDGNVWFYALGGEDGWDVSPYDESRGEQLFEFTGSGTNDLQFELVHHPNPEIVGGSFLIHYYENTKDISRTKKVIWGQ